MEDFRSKRQKLPPEAFAIGPETEPEPGDLIDEETWTDLTHLPDDVSLRTSDHHGTLLKRASDAWGWCVSLVLDIQSLVTDARDDALSLGCLLVTDELQASTYAMMTGFYRQSIAELRSALEAMLMGVYFHRHPDAEKFKRWADGDQGDVGTFHRARGSLARSSPFNLFNDQAEPLTSLMKQGGWVDFLYSTLSGFSHGRPYYVNRFGDRIPSMNVELWGGSNGPIYEDRAVRLWTTYYFDIHLLIVLLTGLAEPRLATLARPTDIPYAAFVERLFAWHPYPPPVARAIARHLLGP